MTLVKIAWRNLWRRARITIILIMGIGAGVFSIILHEALREGFLSLIVDSAVNMSTGHIQVHHDNYLLKKDVTLTIPDSTPLSDRIKTIPFVTGVSPRVVSYGIVSSPESTHFAKIYGICPDLERRITVVESHIVEGERLNPADGAGICLGKALAEKLRVSIGDKVVVMARDRSGDMSGSAFRIRGLFRTTSREFDKSHVYINSKSVREILALRSDDVHEIAVKIEGAGHLRYALESIRALLKDKELEASPWQELSPVAAQTVEISDRFGYIVFLIIFVAMAFGIINSFYMKIFDRIREYGIIMALGTRPSHIFVMLMYEAFFLAILGSAAGSLIAVAFVTLVMRNRLDYAMFSEALQSFGYSSVQPLIITPKVLILCLAGAVLTALAATILPALRASRFKPQEAIRYI